ncbi:phasin family protein [Humitalea sp. 24SJ18S-53]|uniref:phasin family protein n=1 Tax=Humitalea sp. 24SJ18S-53 TaxID=3422307 RepID=UPI003D67F5F8
MAETKTTPTEKVARIATDATAAGAEQAKKIVQDSTVQAKKFFEDGASKARAAIEDGVAKATKSSEDLMKAAQDAAEFGRGNVEALTKATQTYMAGVQDLSKQTLALVQGLAEHAMEGAKALAAVKSLKEAADVQSAFAKAGFEKAMSETAKLQEATLKLVETAAAPITARATAAMEKVTKPLAA